MRMLAWQGWSMPEMDWTAVVASTDDGYTLGEPASVSDLTHAESALGTRLPDLLRDLYLAMNGVFDAPGQWHVIWPLDRVVAQNLHAYNNEGSPRDEYVGFGDDGTGNQFCVRRNRCDEVVYWNPIDNDATLLADDLATFWSRLNDETLPPH